MTYRSGGGESCLTLTARNAPFPPNYEPFLLSVAAFWSTFRRYKTSAHPLPGARLLEETSAHPPQGEELLLFFGVCQ
jgi:hypothetical protein